MMMARARRSIITQHQVEGSLKRAMNDDIDRTRRDLGDRDLRLLSALTDDELSATERADIAFAAYTPEQRHPVEVAAPPRDQLVDWLSRRLGQSLAVPSLREYGYSLIDGPLLPGEFGPAAQFMYQNTAGARLTMYVAAVPKHKTAFSLFRDGNRSTFYWGSRGRGCALTGLVSEVRLRSMAIDACSVLGLAFRSRETSDGLNP
jgi:hypothetical protein